MKKHLIAILALTMMFSMTCYAEDVIVIGAGMAGLGAGKELMDDGRFNVIVLEANGHVGGRIKTLKVNEGQPDEYTYELIAQYHSGPNTSALSDIIDEAGIYTEAFEWTFKSFDIDGSRNPISQKDWWRYSSIVSSEAKHFENDIDYSLADLIVDMRANRDFKRLKTVKTDLEHAFCVASLFEQDYVADADQIRAYGLWEGDNLLGGDEIFPDGGWSQIPEYVAQGQDIRLHHVVTDIEYDSNGVTVNAISYPDWTYGDPGDPVPVEFTADRVIVTVSLGVLKAGDITFSPALPSYKTAAIDRLGYGVSDKVWLHFPSKFWNSKDFIGYVGDPAGEYSSWNYFGGKSLVLWTAGTQAYIMEMKSDEQIIDGCMDKLRIMYGYDIPEPNSTKIIRFHPDAVSQATTSPDYFKGSYSFLQVGSTPDDRVDIAQDVMGRVFFAGEATSSENPALVQGAYETGLREAGKVKALQ